MPKVGITDTILRDGHQSQAATRMKISQMEPMFDKLDKVGYYSLECWGGATFDSCLRFLNLGAPAHPAQGPAQHQAANASARPEHSGL